MVVICRALVALLVVGGALVACGTPAATTEGGSSAQAAETSMPSNADSVGASISPAATAANTPSGELRIATGISLPASLVANEGTNGYNLVTYGAGETLMRLTPEQELVPWLAESIAQEKPTTWRIVLRSGVRFHDGTTMTARDVATSLRASLDTLAGAKNFLPVDVQLEAVDDTTLVLTTPTAQGNVGYSLANWNFVIARAAVDGISPMTGMYRPLRLEKDQELLLENFPDYWDSTPPLERVIVRKVPDANARSLALQSGDFDMLVNVPPEIASSLPPDIEQASIAGTRMHLMLLNHKRPPFDDQRVREAASLAIDRAALLQAALDGQGAVATNIYPPSIGIEIIKAQTFDAARAATLLDEAGWTVGANGVREKDGQPLRFTLLSYPGRPELTQIALVIEAQLRALGFDPKVEEVPDVLAVLKTGDFEASMYSLGVAADPQYAPGITLIEGADYNFSGYRNADLEAAFTKLRAESDPATRATLAAQIQEIVKADTPNIYLVVPPMNTAYRADVKGYVPNPNDLYLVTHELRKD